MNTNATVRFSSARMPALRVAVTRWWPVGWRREYIEARATPNSEPLTFCQIKPNKVWVQMVPSAKKPGAMKVGRTAWLIPDAGAIEDVIEQFNQSNPNDQHHQPLHP